MSRITSNTVIHQVEHSTIFAKRFVWRHAKPPFQFFYQQKHNIISADHLLAEIDRHTTKIVSVV